MYLCIHACMTVSMYAEPKRTRREPVAEPKPNPDPTSVIDSNDVVAKVGSKATADELSTLFKHEIIKEVDPPPGGSAAAQRIKLCLTAAVGANKRCALRRRMQATSY